MNTLIDTNVIIAMLKDDGPHHEWGVEKLQEYQAIGPILISDIVFCELSVGMNNLGAVRQVVSELGLERLAASDRALFRAGEAFKEYRKNKGIKANVLSDFIIGGDASTRKLPLITANAKDYIGYFPEITVIHPCGKEGRR